MNNIFIDNKEINKSKFKNKQSYIIINKHLIVKNKKQYKPNTRHSF